MNYNGYNVVETTYETFALAVAARCLCFVYRLRGRTACATDPPSIEISGRHAVTLIRRRSSPTIQTPAHRLQCQIRPSQRRSRPPRPLISRPRAICPTESRSRTSPVLSRVHTRRIPVTWTCAVSRPEPRSRTRTHKKFSWFPDQSTSPSSALRAFPGWRKKRLRKWKRKSPVVIGSGAGQASELSRC